MSPSKKTKPATRKPRSLPPIKFSRTPVEAIEPEQQIIGAPLLGKIAAYDNATREIELMIEEPLSVGDAIRVKGSTTDLTQRVERLRIGDKSIQSALPGEIVRIPIADSVTNGDAVYKIRSS